MIYSGFFFCRIFFPENIVNDIWYEYMWQMCPLFWWIGLRWPWPHDPADPGDGGGAGLRVEEAAAASQSPGAGGGVQDGGARDELTGRTSVDTSGVQLIEDWSLF